jgi:hypothetical protein
MPVEESTFEFAGQRSARLRDADDQPRVAPFAIAARCSWAAKMTGALRA